MNGKARRAWVVVAGMAGLILGLWWLFGVSIWQGGRYTFVARRVFGRATRVHVLEGLSERERILFSWSEPYEAGDPITECAAVFPERWQDVNGDGRWDTWHKRLGPDEAGRCKVQYEADTDLDGRADWTFILGFGQQERAAKLLKVRRGF